jgi:transcriptional regulator with XRE-family HTH domain
VRSQILKEAFEFLGENDAFMELKLKDVLSRIIHNRRLGVREISKATGVSPSSLHEWLAGRAPRNPLQIKAVANHLGVSLDELLFDETAPIKSNLKDLLDQPEIHGLFEVHIKRVQDSTGDK